MSLNERKRSIDVEKLDEPSVEQLSIDISSKLKQICDDAHEKINRLLSIYGMSAKIAIAFDTLKKEEETSQASE